MNVSDNKSVFFRDGSEFTIGKKENLDMLNRLPGGTYRVAFHPLRGFYLERMENFTTPAKLYGHTNEQAERILTTFMSRERSTGVLLTGTAGSGKTMLSKRVSELAMKNHDVITLVVNQAYTGDDFNNFLAAIEQPSIVLFDEFEKVYDIDGQNRLLTLLDGTFSSRKLYILTANEFGKVNRYITNRPGRMYYALDFKGLDKDFIKEYCDDKLIKKSDYVGVIVASQFFWEFSFDMLQALVEEMNRYGENATQAMKMLNMKPMSSGGGIYEVHLYRGEKRLNVRAGQDDTINASPMAKNGYMLDLYPPIHRDPETGERRVSTDPNDLTENLEVHINNDLMVKYDMDNDVFVYNTEHPGYTLQFKRQVPKSMHFNYDAF
jgi:hypothetical protein